jgi:hypothetical protein
MAAVDQQGSPADQHSVELQVLRPDPVQDDDPAPSEATPAQYPRGIRLVLITIGLILSIFTSALDTTIISTALPAITDDFGTISDIAWYGTSMVITHTAFQSCWGKAYKYFSLKAVFLLSILVFEAGNIICAVAPKSETLIFGRVVAGCGSGGIMTGAFIIIALTAGPKYRALYMGVLCERSWTSSRGHSNGSGRLEILLLVSICRHTKYTSMTNAGQDQSAFWLRSRIHHDDLSQVSHCSKGGFLTRKNLPA